MPMSSARKTFPAKYQFSEPPRGAIGFIALERIPAEGMPGQTHGPNPTRRLSDSRRRSGCIPAEPYPPLEQNKPKATTGRQQHEQLDKT